MRIDMLNGKETNQKFTEYLYRGIELFNLEEFDGFQG